MNEPCGSLDPMPGDGTRQLLKKILMALGGSACQGDTENHLLAEILRRINTVGPCLPATDVALVRQILETIISIPND